MNGNPGVAEASAVALVRRIFQQLNVAPLPHSGSEIMLDNGNFIAAPEARHQENAAGNAPVAQQQALIRRAYAEPFAAYLLQGARAFHRAVTVGIGLHHRAHDGVRPNVVLEGAKVVLKRGERNLRPCGAHEPFLDVGIIKHRENKQDWLQRPPFHAEKSSGGGGYLLLVPGALKTALIAAYLLGNSDDRVGTCSAVIGSQAM